MGFCRSWLQLENCKAHTNKVRLRVKKLHLFWSEEGRKAVRECFRMPIGHFLGAKFCFP